jgi:hypothetical protein
VGHRPRRRRKKREPGRGHDDKDRPAIIAWVSRQGPVVVPAGKDCTIKTGPQAANLAVPAGSRRSTDSASSSRGWQGDGHAYVTHTQHEEARGAVHDNRAAGVFSLLKPFLRVFRGISTAHLPGYLGFFQFVRTFRPQKAFEQAELIVQAA